MQLPAAVFTLAATLSQAGAADAGAHPPGRLDHCRHSRVLATQAARSGGVGSVALAEALRRYQAPWRTRPRPGAHSDALARPCVPVPHSCEPQPEEPAVVRPGWRVCAPGDCGGRRGSLHLRQGHPQGLGGHTQTRRLPAGLVTHHPELARVWKRLVSRHKTHVSPPSAWAMLVLRPLLRVVR